MPQTHPTCRLRGYSQDPGVFVVSLWCDWVRDYAGLEQAALLCQASHMSPTQISIPVWTLGEGPRQPCGTEPGRTWRLACWEQNWNSDLNAGWESPNYIQLYDAWRVCAHAVFVCAFVSVCTQKHTRAFPKVQILSNSQRQE